MTYLNAVDTAHYQEDNRPEIDFNASPDVKLWIIKATQGINYVDPRFKINRAKLKGVKKYRGYYHFLSSNYAIPLQVNHFCEQIGSLEPGEFLMIDAERDESTGKDVTAAQVLEAAQLIKQRFGNRLAVYTGVFVDGGAIWKSTEIFDGYTARIFAAYVSEDRAKASALPFYWDMWQYSSSGPVPGVTGDCDMNRVDNWDIFDFISDLKQPLPPPVGKESSIVKILTNSEISTYKGTPYQPGVIKWGLMEDGTKRHLEAFEFFPMYANDTSYALSNAQLISIPDNTVGSATCRFHGGPWPISMSGSVGAG